MAEEHREKKYLHGLNSRQKEAILSTNGPLLILAGAGAGKTKTLTHRVLHLIHEGVAPTAILAITFTNKAAKEMRDRVERLISEDTEINRPISMFERPFVSTFHSLGVHILKENSKYLQIPRHFSIFDRQDSLSAVREAVKESNLDPKQYEPGRILSLISRKKGDGVSFEKFRDQRESAYFQDRTEKVLVSVWEKYEDALRKEKAFDFDDLLLKTLHLLQNNSEILEYYQKTWSHIHIDEYQDTNRVQYDMAKLLARSSRNICVVGDIDQSIYSWRGADFKNIMRFEKDYPDTKTILLEENYRSTKTILEAANTVISKNTLRKEKNLFTSNEDGEKISVYGAFSEEDEARFVGDRSLSLIQSGVPPRNIAVLYRANFQSRVLEEAFLRNGTPYQVLGVRFFERREVKDVLSYLRASLNPENLSDLKRIINSPPRGIGKTTIAKLFSGEEASLPANTLQKIANFKGLLQKIKNSALTEKPSETLGFIILESGMKDEFDHANATEDDRERLENLFELVSLATKYDQLSPEQGIEKLLEDASLASDQDEMEKDRNAVKLMTVHASKGLEFEYVFVTGLEEDLFPHSKGGKKENIEAAEEERRLFYVALTRAQKKLFLSFAAVRTIFGSKQINVPSEFLEDIGDHLMEPEEAGKLSTVYLD